MSVGALYSTVRDELMKAMLNATCDNTYGIGVLRLLNSTASAVLKTKTVSGTDWATPAGGRVSLTVPVLTTQVSNGTIAKFYPAGADAFNSPLMDQSGGGANILPAGVSNGSQGCVVDVAVIAAADACNITDFRIQQNAANGTVAISTTLRNRILAWLTRQSGAVFSGNGTIKIYTGSAPASADAAATGTELISFATTNTTWNASSGGAGSSALAATLTATASATGTAGYARFSWSDGVNTYVIQGSIGTTGTDFVVNSTAITSSTSYNLTSATIALPT